VLLFSSLQTSKSEPNFSSRKLKYYKEWKKNDKKLSLVDEDQSGKINKAEFKKFLAFVNETQALGLGDAEINSLNDEIFKELGKTELTFDDVLAVVAARWGA